MPAPHRGAGEDKDFLEIEIVDWEAVDSAGGLFPLSRMLLDRTSSDALR